VVEELIEGHPGAIKSREDKWGRLPLHIACIHAASAQVLRLLVDRYVESLRITDRLYGRLPLHFACLYGSPFETMLLVNAEQHALVFKDVNGKTPKDLVEESSNPHREIILKRLEDRTRSVTEAMSQRRKQQQQESPSLAAKKRSSLRRANSERGITPLRDINKEKRHVKFVTLGSADNETKQEKRRAKFTVLGSADDETVSKGNALKTKSMGLGLTEKHNRTVRTIKGGLAAEQRHQKLRRPHAVDDSDIGKKSKPFRRNRLGSKMSSRSKIEPRTVSPTTVRDDAPNQKNGRILLSKNTESSEFDSEEQESKKKSKEPPDILAMFLQSREVDNSKGEYEEDHKSTGARSLPTYMHSALLEEMSPENSETNRIANTFMFHDASEITTELDEQVISCTKGALDITDSEASNDEEKSPELVSVEDRLRNLDIRREALSQECKSVYDNVAKKEDAVQCSRDVISNMRRRIQREEMALLLLETGIQLQMETLAVYEIKIKGVDSEKIQALEEKAKLE
jgi:hypothetical protein